MENQPQPFLVRHDFLIRRLHSLSGLIPVGAFMVVHLVVNASVVEGPSTFQKNVYQIHSLGSLLPLVEWVFIFIPILFHAAFGMVIVAGAMPNSNQYRYGPNYRYTLQRITGMIAFLFIMAHVFHMHGWFHNAYWLENVVRPLGGAEFRAFNAASTAGLALQNPGWVTVYVIGVLSCVYHLANGMWTMGITWGVWTSPGAQVWASRACLVIGILLSAVSMAGLFGMRAVGEGEALQEAIVAEDQMYEHKTASGEIAPNDHKRSGHEEASDDVAKAERGSIQ